MGPPGPGPPREQRGLGHAEIGQLRVASTRDEDVRRAHVACTLSALLLRGGQAFIAHVGDTRVYHLRDGRLDQLTRDHTVIAELLAAGAAEDGADLSRWAHVVTRALGVHGSIEADVRAVQVRVGDVFLICSDGLVDVLSHERIASILAGMSPIDACRAAVSEAVSAGTRDNTTVVVVRVTRP
jgi:protein phosphatase